MTISRIFYLCPANQMKMTNISMGMNFKAILEKKKTLKIVQYIFHILFSNIIVKILNFYSESQNVLYDGSCFFSFNAFPEYHLFGRIKLEKNPYSTFIID